MTEYDPISVLMDEHQQFLRELERFATEMHRLSTLPRIPPLEVRKIVQFGQFLARDVDGWHGRKEEEALFPALGRYLPADAGPIGVMLSEHELVREQQHSIERGALQLESDPEAVEALRHVGAAEQTTRALLADHIDKEDHVLFPMARSLLSPQELSEVGVLCQQIDAARGPADRR